MRSSSIFVVLALIVPGGLSTAARAAEPVAAPPPVVAKVVQRFTADNAGIVVFRQTIVYDVKFPGRESRTEQEIRVLHQDRKTLAIRVHRNVADGRTETAEELAKTQAKYDEQYAGPPHIASRFRLPYYPESVGEYAFSSPRPCAGCTGGAQTVDFTSATKDARHGHGTMTFDPVAARPIKLEFAPYSVAPPANTESLVYTYGRSDDGGWGVVRIEDHLSGQMMGMTGTADRTTTFTHVRHFATVEDARRAL
ncbi:MAG: hypothetical protein QOF71_1979 [Candidatus Eremiobacteraeota bacterium]|jgi:hypothetical protein|nr:hypothetical protein [Candidatus Eremiobacteraeota bacterium]